jgi:hypothetical protein
MTGKTISALSANGGQLPEDYHIPRQGRINRDGELQVRTSALGPPCTAHSYSVSLKPDASGR